jgi:hypothetical protein
LHLLSQSLEQLSCPRFLWTPYCPEKLEDEQRGIPTCIEDYALAQSRRPMDMMIQGWSIRRFHA